MRAVSTARTRRACDDGPQNQKDAFYVYKAYWSKDAFVHLCGSRYTDRAEDVTEIKVYSNQKKVTLFVDGAEQETKEGARIFRFRVPITGTHDPGSVRDCTDEITVRKVDAPNPDYIFNKQGDVVNWFDKEDFKADHYSISDTLGELAKMRWRTPLCSVSWHRLPQAAAMWRRA